MRVAGNQVAHPSKDVDENGIVSVDTRHVAFDQKPVHHQIGKKGGFFRSRLAELGHAQTSLATSRSPASVVWMRSLAIISGADIASRRCRPTLNFELF